MEQDAHCILALTTQQFPLACPAKGQILNTDHDQQRKRINNDQGDDREGILSGDNPCRQREAATDRDNMHLRCARDVTVRQQHRIEDGGSNQTKHGMLQAVAEEGSEDETG